MEDPNIIKSWAEAAGATFTAIKSAIGLLPSGKKRDEAERFLADAEREHKKAEAGLAQKLGFELCEYCWPPEIVLALPETGKLGCRNCRRRPARFEREKQLLKHWRKNDLNYDA